MAVLENIVTAEGDVLRIRTEAPIVGLLSLSQFVDTTVSESQTDYFLKEFRYSVNGGLTFEEWRDLSLLNIQGVNITKFDSFILEYRYTRVGNTQGVDLEFKDILVSGSIEDLPYPNYNKSAFIHFFSINDINVYGWALNVLEKLYTRGLILPDYIERSANQSNLEDEDFIVYWNSITHLFALVVYFARQFENFSTNSVLVEQFLKSKDLTISPSSSFEDVLYLFNNYIEEYKKRGTNQPLGRKSEGENIDGEFIRLLGVKEFEEFIFALFQNFESGWCVGKSSPTWTGTENILNLIKGYEFSDQVESLNNYPFLNLQYASVVDGKIELSAVPGGVFSGIGGDTKMIKIVANQDYEISFRVSQSIKSNNITLGCRMYDEDNNEVQPTDINSDLLSHYFFKQVALNLPNEEYWVRGVLFHHGILGNDEVESANLIKASKVPTIGYGSNLVINPNAVRIAPIIGVEGGTGTVKISSVRIRPLRLNFSRGQLGMHNIIYMLARNNNGDLSNEKIEQFISGRLIPYNSFLKTKFYE